VTEEAATTVVAADEKTNALTKVRVRWLALPPSWRWKVVQMPAHRTTRGAFEIMTDSAHLAFVEADVTEEVLEALVMAPEDVRLLLLRVSRLEGALRNISDLTFTGSTDLSSVKELAKRALDKEEA
jgi:hypothetical protein